jgi:hypothetical protein
MIEIKTIKALSQPRKKATACAGFSLSPSCGDIVCPKYSKKYLVMVEQFPDGDISRIPD